MADRGSVGRWRELPELLFLHRLAPPARIAVVLPVVVACCLLGVYSLDIQAHFATHPDGRVTALLARGSTAATAWIGWVAALFFLIALRRVRAGGTEPPAGRRPLEEMTASQLRHGLIREYTGVRVGFVALSAAAVVETVRVVRYAVAAAGGHRLARATLVPTIVEAAGVIAAALVLALWMLSFRRHLVRVGALAP